MCLAQYSRFIVVGGLVAVITIACRELIGYLLGVDTPLRYSMSVVAAYGLGIVLSFVLNSQFTFASKCGYGWSRFGRFVAIAIFGMFLTWLLSIAFRYGLRLQSVFGDASAGFAFATAAFLSSVLTYPLNAVLVFGPRVR
jgi:putative flippase GtrA